MKNLVFWFYVTVNVTHAMKVLDTIDYWRKLICNWNFFLFMKWVLIFSQVCEATNIFKFLFYENPFAYRIMSMILSWLRLNQNHVCIRFFNMSFEHRIHEETSAQILAQFLRTFRVSVDLIYSFDRHLEIGVPHFRMYRVR